MKTSVDHNCGHVNTGKVRYIEDEIDGIPDSFSDIKLGDSVSATVYPDVAWAKLG